MSHKALIQNKTQEVRKSCVIRLLKQELQQDQQFSSNSFATLCISKGRRKVYCGVV